MTALKIQEVLDLYERKLSELIGPESRNWRDGIGHLPTMIPAMRQMLADSESLRAYIAVQLERTDSMNIDIIGVEEAEAKFGALREKLMRWLGFMQGVFFAEHVFTIDEMRAHGECR